MLRTSDYLGFCFPYEKEVRLLEGTSAQLRSGSSLTNRCGFWLERRKWVGNQLLQVASSHLASSVVQLRKSPVPGNVRSWRNQNRIGKSKLDFSLMIGQRLYDLIS